MSLSRRAKLHLLAAASMTAPVLAAQAMRLLGAGPSTSTASVTAPPPPVAVIVERPADPTPEQNRALQWLLLRADGQPVRSPMAQPVAPPPPPITPDPVPIVEPIPRPGPDPIASLTVTAIMARDDGGLATINGKIYAVGSSPLAGWTVTLIDPDKRLVQLTHRQGRVADLVLKTPEPANQ